MSWGSRNFPMSGRNWKDPKGTYQTDWALSWLIGSAVLLVVFLVAAFAFGYL